MFIRRYNISSNLLRIPCHRKLMKTIHVSYSILSMSTASILFTLIEIIRHLHTLYGTAWFAGNVVERENMSCIHRMSLQMNCILDTDCLPTGLSHSTTSKFRTKFRNFISSGNWRHGIVNMLTRKLSSETIV
jgi:hypothetical protein